MYRCGLVVVKGRGWEPPSAVFTQGGPLPHTNLTALVDMYINMCILIYMNIYISPKNEAKLRKEKSMSGLINDLLEDHYSRALADTLKTTTGPEVATPSNKREKIKFCKHGYALGLCKYQCK